MAVDLGCGTGIFSQLLLDNGWNVTGVEPNSAMSEKADPILQNYSQFTLVEGQAEKTGLPSQGADLVTAAQAFHWFDPVGARDEMERILSPEGHILLVWNTRDITSGFGKDYEELLSKHCPREDYAIPHREWDEERLRKWFHPRVMEIREYSHPQYLNWETLRGRLASTSYAPKEGSPEWINLEQELRCLFEIFQKEGFVLQNLSAKVYFG